MRVFDASTTLPGEIGPGYYAKKLINDWGRTKNVRYGSLHNAKRLFTDMSLLLVY